MALHITEEERKRGVEERRRGVEKLKGFFYLLLNHPSTMREIIKGDPKKKVETGTEKERKGGREEDRKRGGGGGG